MTRQWHALCGALIICLLKVGQLTGAEASYPEHVPLTKPGVKIAIPSRGSPCHLETAGDAVASDQAPNHFELRLTCGKTTQVLSQWGASGWDDPKMELIASGDFDNDRKVDLDLELSAKYSSSRRVLMLSSKASRGELVGQAARGRDVQEYLLRAKPPARNAATGAAEKVISSVQDCLKRRDAGCLSKHILAEVYFPDFNAFGCQPKGTKSKVADTYAGAEIAACAMSSSVQYPSPALTLFQVLDRCFNSPQPLTTLDELANGQTIEPENAFSCHFEKKGDRYQLKSVAAGG